MLAHDERWQLALRITSSQQFAKAAQLREILLYITRRWLLDENVSIREQEIACRVLGRRGDFNPAEDNIVRVQISHLRRKLDQYFASEGAEELLELKVPKGSYVPRFEKRADSPKPAALPLTVAFSKPECPAPEPAPATVSEPPSSSQSSWVRKNWPAPLLAALIVFAFSVGRFSRIPEPARAAVQKLPANPLLSHIFLPGQPVSVVVADTNLVVLQNELHTDISIDDYISRDYPENVLRYASNPEQRSVLQHLALRRFTSLADVNVATRCAELSQKFGSITDIRYARNLNARDFEQGNFILVGSRTADPWVALFESQLNFKFEQDLKTHAFHFLNRNPLPGEDSVYFPRTGDDVSSTSYVDIALIPNLSKTGYVLLLNAATMDANEAAMRLVLHDELPPSLSGLMHLEKGQGAGDSSYEIFLRDHAINGVVRSFDVLSVRKLA